MIVLITGASHTGKTKLAQTLLETYHYPYLSIDHLKMGLIRSHQTTLTPLDDDQLTAYLWPIIREIIKTAIENNQHLIVEGCYIPLTYQTDFSRDELSQIKFVALAFSEHYISTQYDEIIKHSNVIEQRLFSGYKKETMIKDNLNIIQACETYQCRYVLIQQTYDELKQKVEILLNLK